MRVIPLLALALFSATISAQLIGFGVKAGVPLNDAFSSLSGGRLQTAIDNPSFTVGPTAELRLPFGLSVEADALYRGLSYRYALSGLAGSTPPNNFNRSSTQWSFPILAKYRFHGLPLLRPYAEAGPAFRYVTNVDNNGSAGFAFGGGVELKLLFLRISPEIRYTRWSNSVFTAARSPSFFDSQNQADFLVGFSF